MKLKRQVRKKEKSGEILEPSTGQGVNWDMRSGPVQRSQEFPLRRFSGNEVEARENLKEPT